MSAEWKRRIIVLFFTATYAACARGMEAWLAKRLGLAPADMVHFTRAVAMGVFVVCFIVADSIPDAQLDKYGVHRLGVPWRSLAAAVLVTLAIVGTVLALSELQREDLEWSDVMGAD
jgi:hypothetical protein